MRHRREDIPLLTERFLNELGKEQHLSSEALQLLMANEWPGNVRELKNAVESAAVLSDHTILPSNLPISLKRNESIDGASLHWKASLVNGDGKADMDSRLKEIERQLIVQALHQSGGIQVKAAAILGIKERSLWHRIKKHRIDIAEFKA